MKITPQNLSQYSNLYNYLLKSIDNAEIELIGPSSVYKVSPVQETQMTSHRSWPVMAFQVGDYYQTNALLRMSPPKTITYRDSLPIQAIRVSSNGYKLSLLDCISGNWSGTELKLSEVVSDR